MLADRVRMSAGGKFDDISGSPGESMLIAGDMITGYFGTVLASELWTGTQLSSAVGISQGTIQYDDTPWLKFALDGKILFRPMKAFRHSISYNAINSAGCAYGTKTVAKNGLTYKVRLMKTGLVDPMTEAYGAHLHGSEWNRLMLPIHTRAKYKNWVTPENVEASVPYWGIDFTDGDLNVDYKFGNGTHVWCQERRSTYRLVRGYLGVSDSEEIPPSSTNDYLGWAPILELDYPPQI